MKRMKAKYSGALSSGASFRLNLTSGRCVLHGIWMSSNSGGSLGQPPQVKFSTGNDYSDIRCQVSCTTNSDGTNYASGCTFDIPSDGILFEDGIYVEGNAIANTVTIFYT